MRHCISLKEQSKDDLLEILDTARRLKDGRAAGLGRDLLRSETLLMLFQKSSTRTRVSFEAAMTELGGHAVFLDARTTQFGLADFKDEIRALVRFGAALVFRARRADDVRAAAGLNRIPVIDACSEKYHPAQALSDLFTMAEHSGGIDRVEKVAWLGIQNNVSNTLKLACAKLGIEIAVASPEADPASVDPELDRIAEETGKVRITSDLREALEGAAYVHTDTWMNMEYFEDGKVKPEASAEYERRKQVFMPFQLTASLIESYAPQAKIMHCMPCHPGYEITRDAIDHANSIIFDQAENRLHLQKGLLLWLLEKQA